jgi:hypothetical protein
MRWRRVKGQPAAFDLKAVDFGGARGRMALRLSDLRDAGVVAPAGQMPAVSKSFLFLFFRKEALASLILAASFLNLRNG